MTDDLNSKVFAQMIKNAGLDFTRKADVDLFDAACGEYQGDNITRDIRQVLANAASKKSPSESLDKYFDNFREQERAKNPATMPKQKDPKDMSGFEQLEAYNRAHPLFDTSPASTPKESDKPMSEQDGVSILEKYNREHPL